MLAGGDYDGDKANFNAYKPIVDSITASLKNLANSLAHSRMPLAIMNVIVVYLY